MIWQSNSHLTVAKLIIPLFTWTESRSFSSKSRTASWADVFRERAPFCSPLHTRPSLWYWTMGIVKKSCRPVTAQTADASFNLCPSGDWLYKKQIHQSICAHQVTVQKADASIKLCPAGDCTNSRCINQSAPIRGQQYLMLSCPGCHSVLNACGCLTGNTQKMSDSSPIPTETKHRSSECQWLNTLPKETARWVTRSQNPWIPVAEHTPKRGGQVAEQKSKSAQA